MLSCLIVLVGFHDLSLGCCVLVGYWLWVVCLIASFVVLFLVAV